LVILAIVALIAIFVVLWNKCEGFRNFWKQMWDYIVAAATTWWETFSGLWTMIGGWFVSLFAGWWALFTGFWSGVFSAVGSAWGWIVGKWNAMVSFVTGLPGRIAGAASGMWDGIKNAFRGALNWIIDRWNGLSFRLPSVDVPGFGKVGGFTLSTPNIRRFATGGIASGLSMVGERGAEILDLPSGTKVIPASQVGTNLAGAIGGREDQPQRVLLGSDGSHLGDALIDIIGLAVKRRGGDPKLLGIKV
jgi:hypothetical protein